MLYPALTRPSFSVLQAVAENMKAAPGLLSADDYHSAVIGRLARGMPGLPACFAQGKEPGR